VSAVDDKRVFTLNGEIIDLAELLAHNTFEPLDIDHIQRLEVHERIVYGGGAFAEFVLRRVR
jgi:hypothetical protein